MSDIIVRVGAALDRSFDVVMGEVEKKSQRAYRAQLREANRAAGELSGVSKSQLDESKLSANQMLALARWRANNELKIERDRYREQSSLNRALLREQSASERQSARIAEQASRAAQVASRQRTAERIKNINREESAERAYQQRLLRMQIQGQREANRAKRTEERRAIRESYSQDREIDRFATRTSHRATRFFFPRPEGALGYGKRIATDLVRGAGVDMSLASGVTKARDRESAAVALSNQGWNPDAQGFDDRIKAGELREVAKREAYRLGLKGEDEAIEAMTKFTDVTGDLATAKAIIGDIGMLARSTGTDLASAAAAAADMSAQLPDDMQGEARQKTMQLLLNTAAMQGKRGAVEVKDLARYVPRIAAQAQAFGGGADQAMVQLLATAQIARRFGGAGNAAQAATSVQAMVNTLKTPARVAQFREQFKRAGFTGERADLYDSTGRMRSIQSIIKDSIVAASTDKDPQIAFKKMWGNVLGAKAPEGLRNVYAKAEATEKGTGLAAIDAEFKKFSGALDFDAQQKMLDEVTKTTEAKVNRFQQSLDNISEKMATRLAPTMESLAPKALALVDGFAKVVEWAAKNPGEAISAAIVASIGRAGIESGIRMVIDRAATSIMQRVQGVPSLAPGVGTPVGAAPTAAGVGVVTRTAGAVGGALNSGMGAAINTINVAAVAAASFMVTTAVIESASTTLQEADRRQKVSANDIWMRFQEDYANAGSDEERTKAKDWAKKNIQQDEESRGFFDKLMNGSEAYFKSLKAIDEVAKSIDDRRESIAGANEYQEATGQSTVVSEIGVVVARELLGALGKTLNVRVTNTEEFQTNAAPPAEGDFGDYFRAPA